MTPEQILERAKKSLQEEIEKNNGRIDMLNEDIIYSRAWINCCEATLKQLNGGGGEK